MSKKVIEKVNLKDEIDDLPDGQYTQFADDVERRFSAIFLQRFAIARALIKKNRELLLDDPMDHIDKQSEQAILEVIQSLKRQMTILMITHRPSHFKLADRLVELNKGVILTRLPVKEEVKRG